MNPKYKWAVVGMLWFVCFLNYSDRQAMNSVLPLLARDFKFDAVALGWIGSAFAWVYAFSAPLAGVAADHFVRKRLIVWACVGWSILTLATAWCGGFASLVTVRALIGLGEALYFPAAMALISDYHAPETRSRALSWHQSAVYAGTILGSWLAAVLAERHGWRTPFYFFGPFGVLLAVLLAGGLREPRRGAADGQPLPDAPSGRSPAEVPSLSVAETMRIIFRTRSVMFLMAGFFCANLVAVIFLTWTPAFLVDKFHYSIGSAGLTGTVYIHLASALTVPLAGWLADRLSRRFLGGRIAVQIAGLVCGMAFVFLVGNTSRSSTLLLAMTGFGACKGFYDSGIFASLYDAIEPRARGTAAGIMNTAGWSGGALGPVAVGFATKYGRHAGNAVANMSEALAGAAVFYLFGAILLLAAAWSLPRRTAVLAGAAA